MNRLVVRLAVAAFLAATAGLGAPGPAQAATCGTANGVSVVVDFHQLGGGVQTACDLHGAGRTAAVQLTDVGHTLTYVQRQPGFVCRVDGSPSSDPCVNTPPSDAYWSVWWSDGTSGKWSYSSAGVASLKVPAGGYVALSWQGGGDRATPRTSPVPHPSASPSPTHAPTSHPTALPSSSSPAPTTSAPAPSRSTATGVPVRHHHLHALKASAGKHGHGPASTQADPLPSRAAADSGSGSGLPGWVAPVLVALVFVAAAAVAVVRRKRSGGA